MLKAHEPSIKAISAQPVGSALIGYDYSGCGCRFSETRAPARPDASGKAATGKGFMSEENLRDTFAGNADGRSGDSRRTVVKK